MSKLSLKYTRSAKTLTSFSGLNIFFMVFALTSIGAFAIESNSYTCKTFRNQTQEHRDIRVEIGKIDCVESSCNSKTKIYFKKKTIFNGILTLDKSIMSAPDSITTVLSDRRIFSPVYGTFLFAHEVYLDGRPDFIYGQI